MPTSHLKCIQTLTREQTADNLIEKTFSKSSFLFFNGVMNSTQKSTRNSYKTHASKLLTQKQIRNMVCGQSAANN